MRGEKVSDRASGGTAAIDEFNWDGMGKGERVQMVQKESRWVNEGIGSTRVHQGPETDGRKAWHEELHQKRKVTGTRVGKGKR